MTGVVPVIHVFSLCQGRKTGCQCRAYTCKILLCSFHYLLAGLSNRGIRLDKFCSLSVSNSISSA